MIRDPQPARLSHSPGTTPPRVEVLRADLAIIGGGLGGCAAALAATRLGCRVILTEETGWVGGQLTSR